MYCNDLIWRSLYAYCQWIFKRKTKKTKQNKDVYFPKYCLKKVSHCQYSVSYSDNYPHPRCFHHDVSANIFGLLQMYNLPGIFFFIALGVGIKD